MGGYLVSVSIFLLAAFLVVAPLMFHEMGHWAALRRFGVPISQFWVGLGPVLVKLGRLRIAMLPIGGAVVPSPLEYRQLAPKQRTIVALSGPAASVVYGVIIWCAAVLARGTPAGLTLGMVAHLNFLLAGINLLPIPPLDGYQAWENWRAHRATPVSEAARKLAARLGSGLVYGVGFLVLGLVFFPATK